MIDFEVKKLDKGFKLKKFVVPDGSTILKVFFNEKDIRKTKDGKMHIDLFGSKTLDLLDCILDVVRANRKTEKEKRDDKIPKAQGNKGLSSKKV